MFATLYAKGQIGGAKMQEKINKILERASQIDELLASPDVYGIWKNIPR